MFFVVSTGRSGTKTMAKTLSGLPGCTCRHEPAPELILESSALRYGEFDVERLKRILIKTRSPVVEGNVYGESNQTLSLIIPILAQAFPDAKFVWLVRNGLDVVASTVGRQWYTGHSANHDRYDDCPPLERAWIDGRIQGDRCHDVPEAQWEEMNPFARCCWYWSYINRTIDQDLQALAPDGYRMMWLEEIDEKLMELLPWLGIESKITPQVGRHNPAHYKLYHWAEWSEPEWETFHYWCGPMMDRLYPDWCSRVRGYRKPTARRGIHFTPAFPVDPRISVFLTSYNQKSYLPEAIESILSQTLKPHQIIIVDDGSTDGSQELIGRYARRYPGLITPVYHEKNVGIASTRIDALNAVTGDYVTYVDGDDRFLPTKLEKELHRLLKHPEAQIVYSNNYYMDSDGNRTGVWVEGQVPPQGYVFPQTFARDFPKRSLYRMELVKYQAWKSVGFHDPNISIYEDFDMRIRMTKSFRAVYLDEPLSEIRIHNVGLSNSKKTQHLASLDYIYRKNRPLLNDLSMNEREGIKNRFREWVSNVSNKAMKEIREALEQEQALKGRDRETVEIDPLGSNLIFLISQPRSGSTLLQRILGGHPDLHTVAEPWIMLHPLYAIKRDGISTEYEASLARQGLDDFLMQVPEGEDLYLHALRQMAVCLYGRILHISGKRFFLDKTPRYYFIIRELYRLFPKAKYIFLLRNPLAVLSSILATWHGNRVESLLKSPTYRDLVTGPEKILDGIRHLGEYAIVVNYEELVTEPHIVVQHLCNRLGILFDEAMLNYGLNASPRGRFGDSVGVPKHDRPVSKYVDKWCGHLAVPELSSFARQYLSTLGPNVVKSMGYAYQDLKDQLDSQEFVRSRDSAKHRIPDSHIHLRRGEDLMRQGDHSGAMVAFRQAIESDPENATAYNNIGVLHWQRGEVQEALTLLTKAMEVDPNNSDTVLNCGEVLKSLAREKDAKLFFASYLKRHPEDVEVGRALAALEEETATSLNTIPASSPKIVLYALRELHVPVLLPVYHELLKMDVGDPGFMAPPFQKSEDEGYQEGLSEGILTFFKENRIPFWGHAPTEPYACVVTADFCYDRVDGWGPIVCIGHGTISKGIFFTNRPRNRIENFATVLCLPGPWYVGSFGDQVFTRVEPTGFSKMDALHGLTPDDRTELLQSVGFSTDKTTILFAPTYNPELTSMSILWEIWRELDRNEYQVIFKLHGAAHERWKETYRHLAASRDNFHFAEDPSIAPYMHACDVLVSDVSSVYVEFLSLGKPIVVVNNPDMAKYPGYDPKNIEYQVRDAAYEINRGEELPGVLQQLRIDDPKAGKRKDYAGRLFPPPDGENSKRIAQQIAKVVQGEVTLRPPPGTTGMTVYVPSHRASEEWIEENVKRAAFPVELFSHDGDLHRVGAFPVRHLESHECPPRPFICMTGEHVFPRQWDYLWLLTAHFGVEEGLYGPLLQDHADGGFQQHSSVRGKPPDISPEHLQSVYKFYLCGEKNTKDVESLLPDGMLVTAGVDAQLVAAWLPNVCDPGQAIHLADAARKRGYRVRVLESFYAYEPTGLRSLHAIESSDDGGYLVSAIVSTYNAERFIRGCLEDLEAQTIADRLEIIVVDSGSEQKEGDIVREFQERYPNIQYIRTEQRESIYAAWNRGIRAARGRYITNANTDDRHRKDALEVLARFLDTHPDVDVVFGNQIITHEPNQTFDTVISAGTLEWPDFDRDRLLEYCCVGPQPMWRKSIHDAEQIYFDERLEVVGDYEFWLNLSQKHRLRQIPEFLGVYYRSRDDYNREFLDLHQSRSESYRVRRAYYLKTIAGAGAEEIQRLLIDLQQKIKHDLSQIQATGLTKERKRHLGHLYWRVCVLLERLEQRDPSRRFARDFFSLINDGYMLAFHLKELACSIPSARVQDGPLVSVVIPTYNAEQFVSETVQSVLNQSYEKIEIIIVDDGSEDRTLQILDRFREKHPDTIRSVIQQSNRGPSAARNRGISAANGEFILTLDADDVIAYDYVEKAIGEMSRDPSVDVVFSEAVFFGHKNKIWALNDVTLPDLFLRNQVNVTALFRKRCWEEVSGFDETLPGYEDWDLWIALAARGKKFKRIPEPLFFYRHKVASRGYRSTQKDVEKKLAIMEKHPEIYRMPTSDEMHRLGGFQVIPAEFLKQNPGEERGVGAGINRARHPRKKILFVLHDFPPYRSAGAQLYAKHLAQSINASGRATVDVLYPVFRREYPKKYTVLEKGHAGLRVFELTKEASTEPQKVYHQQVAEAFLGFLRDHEYDLIHVHGLGQLSPAPVHMAKKLGLKVVLTLHDFWFLCDHWHLVRANQDLCSGPDSVEKCINCYLEDAGMAKTAENIAAVRHYHSLRKRTFRETFSMFDRVFAPSRYIKEVFGRYGYKGVERHPNGIACMPRRSKRPGRMRDRLVFGYAGQMIPRKGVNFLIEAFRELPAADVELHLWGAPDEQTPYGRYLKELAKPDDRISWFGAYTSEQLEEIFEAIDIAVIPSLMDNYPIVVQEAFLHQTPVIASRTGGIPEMVLDGENGLLVEPGSKEDLKAKMLAILGDPARIEKFKDRLPLMKTMQEDADFFAEAYEKLLTPPLPGVQGKGLIVQFYVMEPRHWLVFEDLYHYLHKSDDAAEIVICLPDPAAIGPTLLGRLQNLDATFVLSPRVKQVDVTFVSSGMVGKVSGCGRIVELVQAPPNANQKSRVEMGGVADLVCEIGAAAKGTHQALTPHSGETGFADLWGKTKAMLGRSPSPRSIPMLSVIVVLRDDNLFAIREQLADMQSCSVMPLELILLKQGESPEVLQFIETIQEANQFVAVRTPTSPQDTEGGVDELAGLREAGGEIVIIIRETVVLYRAFDYLIYKTFEQHPRTMALTGVTNLPVPQLEYRTSAEEPEDADFERAANDLQSRCPGKELEDLELLFLPPLVAFKRRSLNLQAYRDFAEFTSGILQDHSIRLAPSLFYRVIKARDLKRLKDFWTRKPALAEAQLVDFLSEVLEHYPYPDLAERFLEEMLAHGAPKEKLLPLAEKSLKSRFYDPAYKAKLMRIFCEYPEFVGSLQREVDLINRVRGDARHGATGDPAQRVCRGGQRTRALFYFFKNVHIPILIPIYRAMKQLHPEVEIAFGYMQYAPHMRAGFTADELKILRSYGEPMYAVPQEFKPDITFIADSVYPWTQNCGRLVNVGHGVLSKGQYYTDTPLARREQQADLICVPGKYHEDVMSRVVSVPVAATGMAKLDALFSRKIDRESVLRQMAVSQNHCRYILFGPTFNNELSSIPFVLDRINEVIPDDQTKMVIKLHGSTKASYQAMYRELARRDPRVIFSEELDITPFLALCDVMISDVSSAMMEFAALDKPLVLFNNPNRHTYPNYHPNDIEYRWRDIGIQVDDLGGMREAVRESFDSPLAFSEKRRQYTDQLFANKYDGGACPRIVEHALALLNDRSAYASEAGFA